MRRVAVTIVNWNGLEETSACLDALLRSEGVEPRVLVVDNASAGDDAQRLRADPRVERVIELPENRGYAGGMNAGIRAWLEDGTTDPVLVLTPDARPEAGALAAMADALDASPGAGVVGPVVVYRERPRRVIGAGGRIDPGRAEATLLRTVEREDAPYETDWIDGCCMLFRPAALAAVGGYDERYFMYLEEVDLCVRLRRAGWSVRVAPTAIAHHPKEGVGQPAYYYYFMARNRYLFWRKNFDIGSGRVAAAVAGRVVRAFGSWLVSLVWPPAWGEAPARLRRFVRHVKGAVAGTRDHVRGRYGPMPGLHTAPSSNVQFVSEPMS